MAKLSLSFKLAHSEAGMESERGAVPLRYFRWTTASKRPRKQTPYSASLGARPVVGLSPDAFEACYPFVANKLAPCAVVFARGGPPRSFPRSMRFYDVRLTVCRVVAASEVQDAGFELEFEAARNRFVWPAGTKVLPMEEPGWVREGTGP